jgi:hypothetical protein
VNTILIAAILSRHQSRDCTTRSAASLFAKRRHEYHRLADAEFMAQTICSHRKNYPSDGDREAVASWVEAGASDALVIEIQARLELGWIFAPNSSAASPKRGAASNLTTKIQSVPPPQDVRSKNHGSKGTPAMDKLRVSGC